MVIKYKDFESEPFNTSINKSTQDWNVFDNNLTINNHGMMQYNLNLENVVLKGSEENVKKVDQVYSAF